MSPERPELEGVPWVLVAGIDVEGWAAFAPSATLDGQRISGSTGCNRFTAAYALDGAALAVGPVAATRMACPPPAEAVERAYAGALERVAGWRVEEGELVLLAADGGELLRYEAATPAGSWRATGLLRGDVFASVLPGTEITAEFGEGGDLAGTAGCNRYRAAYLAERGGLEITQPASTLMACLEPAGVMEQEAAYLEAIVAARRYRLDGRALELLRADGYRVAAFVRAASP